jgi:hypothetical protein
LDTPVGLDACASVAISTNPNLPDFKVKWWPDTHACYMNMETATALWLNILDNWYLLHNFPRTAALEARSTVEPAMN